MDFARYELVVKEGLPLPEILRAVETHEPDLLVIGTRGGGRVRRTLLGSVASRVLEEVETCDILVVPRDSISAALDLSLRGPGISRSSFLDSGVLQ
jgi:nucleotide-binding universal stress UspA family protein